MIFQPQLIGPLPVGPGDIDLVEAALADVGDDEMAVAPIEGEAPGIAQPERPDEVGARRRAREGIAGRDGMVGRRLGMMVDVQPQHLPEQVVDVLSAALRVAPAAAVPQAEIEIAVRAERDVAAVVVGVGLRDDQQDGLALRIRAIGVERGTLEPREHARAVSRAGVAHEEPAVLGVARMEGEAQEPPFAAREDAAAQIEVGRGQEHAAGEDSDAAALLGDEDPVVPRVGERGRRVEPARQEAELDPFDDGRRGGRGGADEERAGDAEDQGEGVGSHDSLLSPMTAGGCVACDLDVDGFETGAGARREAHTMPSRGAPPLTRRRGGASARGRARRARERAGRSRDSRGSGSPARRARRRASRAPGWR